MAVRCLEFYSGLGGKISPVHVQACIHTLATSCTVLTGMHYALAQSLPKAEVVCAFDINTVANDVYEHNHGVMPYQVMRFL